MQTEQAAQLPVETVKSVKYVLAAGAKFRKHAGMNIFYSCVTFPEREFEIWYARIG